MKQKINYYALTPSQEVVRMQLLFSLDKRVINILMSAESEDKIDFPVMEQAIHILTERHDCLRLNFVRNGLKLKQYFSKTANIGKIPYYEFNTEQEQNEFILNKSKKPIKYLKGKVFEPFFIKSYSGKDMVLVKVCHLILDTYGLNILFKDLFDVYNCLKNGTELPPAPVSFETLIKKELTKKDDKDLAQKRHDFFKSYYETREEPYYAGISGLTTPIAKKHFNKRTMKMFFVKNKTNTFVFEIDSELGQQIIAFCMEHKISPANFLFFACSVCQSKLNNNIKNMLQLELCNCRATMLEKNCSGTKVQSLGCYVEIDHQSKAIDNLTQFCSNQNTFYRYLGYSDMDFQTLTHKVWHSSPIRTYYAMSFSFTPFIKPDGIEFRMYPNGKFALPAYFAVMYDVKTHSMQCIYDCQRELSREKHVDYFHTNFISIIKQILANPEIEIKNIKVDLKDEI